MVSPLSATQSEAQLEAIFSELRKLHAARETDAHRVRTSTKSVLAKLDNLFRRGRPFSGFDKGPPSRAHREPLLSPDSPLLLAASRSLQQFGSLCMNLHDLRSDPLPVKTRDYLLSLVPVILDWIALLHPMNGNLQADAKTQDHSTACYTITATLQGVYLPRLYSTDVHIDYSKTPECVVRAPIIVTYLANLWINLFRYVKDPKPVCVSLIVKLLFGMACRGLPSQSSMPRIPPREPFGYVVRQELKSKPRRLCRLIARYSAKLQGRDHNENAASDIFQFGVGLTLYCGLVPDICPRDAIRELVKTMGDNSKKGHWTATRMGFMYLMVIWRVTADHRAIEWSIDDGIFDVYVYGLRNRPPTPDYVDALDLVGPAIRNAFVYWRVFHAFERRHGAAMGDLRRLADQYPDLDMMIIAYDSRIPILRIARREWKLRLKQRCSYSLASSLAPQMQACRCRAAFYCSIDCQRAHWRQEHRKDCIYGDDGQTTPRDLHFIRLLSWAHFTVNKALIFANINALDPQRQHNIRIYVDLLVSRRQPFRKERLLSNAAVWQLGQFLIT
ncbi:hypothetical protein BD626DRAFT_599067 [Schizophyllum amplum]|uniref:MYND-type domain-containing protein n=1 Tax=Schizophyllum amplum TaxID=97359 RepID=A0A550BS32_9AGAR|nr:hypothetical protein BD626DRAFT_599067 [Auriculariopsis ampla]